MIHFADAEGATELADVSSTFRHSFAAPPLRSTFRRVRLPSIDMTGRAFTTVWT
ncbi:MAG: hypothetical protein IPP17_28710 [Bacteroidetes bacterium]|nr:hypothetical protein [Bacteroidota bacterium]